MATVKVIPHARRHRRRSQAERERILAECDRPGAIIGLVAKQNDVSISQVHKWRKRQRELLAGQALLPAFVNYGSIENLPHVHDADDQDVTVPTSTAPGSGDFGDGPDINGSLQIQFPTGERIVVQGNVADRTIASVICCLRRR